MKRLTYVRGLSAGTALLVMAGWCEAQQSGAGGSAQPAQAPCPPTSAAKKSFNPLGALAALANSVSTMKQTVISPSAAGQVSSAATTANNAIGSSGAATASSNCGQTAAAAANSGSSGSTVGAATQGSAGGVSSASGSAQVMKVSTAAGAAPWTPPSDAPAAPAAPLDPAKLPEIGGIHLGMPLAQAQALMQKLTPDRVVTNVGGPSVSQYSVVNLRYGDGGYGGNSAGVDVSLPPNPQVVWHVIRVMPQPHVARAVLIAALRQKYGKETVAASNNATVPATDDATIQTLWWVFDEQGRLLSGVKLLNNSPYGCAASSVGPAGGSGYYMNFLRGNLGQMTQWCASSYVAVSALLGPLPILDSVILDMVDTPLLMRSVQATSAWMKGDSDRARQQDAERAKQVKPSL